MTFSLEPRQMQESSPALSMKIRAPISLQEAPSRDRISVPRALLWVEHSIGLFAVFALRTTICGVLPPSHLSRSGSRSSSSRRHFSRSSSRRMCRATSRTIAKARAALECQGARKYDGPLRPDAVTLGPPQNNAWHSKGISTVAGCVLTAPKNDHGRGVCDGGRIIQEENRVGAALAAKAARGKSFGLLKKRDIIVGVRACSASCLFGYLVQLARFLSFTFTHSLITSFFNSRRARSWGLGAYPPSSPEAASLALLVTGSTTNAVGAVRTPSSKLAPPPESPSHAMAVPGCLCTPATLWRPLTTGRCLSGDARAPLRALLLCPEYAMLRTSSPSPLTRGPDGPKDSRVDRIRSGLRSSVQCSAVGAQLGVYPRIKRSSRFLSAAFLHPACLRAVVSHIVAPPGSTPDFPPQMSNPKWRFQSRQPRHFQAPLPSVNPCQPHPFLFLPPSANHPLRMPRARHPCSAALPSISINGINAPAVYAPSTSWEYLSAFLLFLSLEFHLRRRLLAMDLSLIDPVLRQEASDGEAPANGAITAQIQPITAIASTSTPSSTARTSASDASNFPPRRDAHSAESEDDYRARLENEKRKAPLAEACVRLGIKVLKSANLIRLRDDLAKYWFPPPTAISGPPRRPRATTSAAPGVPRPRATHTHDVLASVLAPAGHIFTVPHASGSGLPQTSGLSAASRGELRGAAPPVTNSMRSALVSGSTAQRRTSDYGPSTSSSTAIRSPATTTSQHAPVTPHSVARPAAPASDLLQDDDDSDDDDEQALVRVYAAEGAHAEEILGYDDDEDGEDDESDTDSGEEEAAHAAFKKSVRVAAVRRAEGNRRAGGIKTQKAMCKAWDEFKTITIRQKKIKDGIVDEHSLLLYIIFSAEREKRTRRGQPIPGTRLGASQLKKLFFGALRIRKEQDAADKTLATIRPAATFIVWEAIKNRMDEALERVRKHVHYAPDICANTFLSEVTDEQLQRIGYGFLAHRQLRLVIFGHLAWTCQHATGNRGDDFRALKLAELQPYDIPHPNRRTIIPSILGLQGEEKAGKRGMKTVVNPVYSAFIANKNPEMCPLGAFAFYQHYIHDEMDISTVLKIDWSLNKSWRQIRVLHGPKSPNTPYSEQNLYNLYSRAYASAGFSSKMKAHLPRHLLGYRQEAMGVDGADTSKLGWTRGQTYFDTYAPALPKKAILGAAGYRAEDTYDPIWTHVHVPEQFLHLICPKAEEIQSGIADKANLSGAFKYWAMVIDLRPYAFQASVSHRLSSVAVLIFYIQCGAAIFQKCPKSALFRLPAFANEDVRNWMKTTFPTELALLQANAGSPVDLMAVQNDVLRKSLEDLYRICSAQEASLRKLQETLERRTAVLSPAQGFSTSTYHRSGAQRGIFPPLLGQKSARWPDVFALIQQPKMCWAVWGPTRSVNKFLDVDELWATYVDGDAVYNDSGIQTGKKPPLQLVEKYFQARWRSPEDPKERATIAKAWERYREIPQWIAASSERRGVSPAIIIAELEAMRVEPGKATKGLNWLRIEVENLRKEAAQAASLFLL
ncbi:hypothetical protein FB451DRAFT_1491519 [Mycena latifolia]|nr:hypothetical protein FB451DRAFT_1491519 [Mycena latifolia]